MARERAGSDGAVVVSIFVNPLQFGPGEDLDRYPRTFDADLEACCRRRSRRRVRARLSTRSTPAGSRRWRWSRVRWRRSSRGARPGHFRGVLTVVAKLFGLVGPDVAVFGEKDYQQLALIRRMVADLCFPIEIVGGPTDREPDGLARSSRNVFLDAEQREQAVALSRACSGAAEGASDGYDAALAAGRAELRQAAGVDLDYFVILPATSLSCPTRYLPGRRRGRSSPPASGPPV